MKILNFLRNNPKVDYFNDYKKKLSKAKSDNEFISNQFENYIYNSLKYDIDIFQNKINDNVSILENMDVPSHWTIKDFFSDRFFLKKKLEGGSPYRDILTIGVRYSYNKETDDIKVSGITGYPEIESQRMKDIVAAYIYTVLIENIKRESRKSKRDLDSVIKVIGKDIIRDDRIDKILNS